MSIKRIDSGFVLVNGWQKKYEPLLIRRAWIEATAAAERAGEHRRLEMAEKDILDGGRFVW